MANAINALSCAGLRRNGADLRNVESGSNPVRVALSFRSNRARSFQRNRRLGSRLFLAILTFESLAKPPKLAILGFCQFCEFLLTRLRAHQCAN
jgi:hypothetical protein